MKIAVIPARGGSKRIPRKNIKNFCGKPIIAWSIEAARDSKCFDKIIVSTDDEEIACVARGYGAEVPFIRPKDLSGDYVGTTPVIQHAINWVENAGEKLEEVCCIYATAPFVTGKVIHDAYQQLLISQADFCFTVTGYGFPIQRAIKITSNTRIEMFNPQHFNTRSQDLDEAYHDAGQFYWGKSSAYKANEILFSDKSSPFVLPRYLVQDIDTPEDWLRAELMFKALIK